MTAITVPLNGRVRSYGTKLTTTGATTVYTAAAGTQPVVIAVNVCNIDGTSSADITLSWVDSSAAATYLIESTNAVAADTNEITEFPVALDDGDTIVATASAANDLDVIVTVVESPGRNRT